MTETQTLTRALGSAIARELEARRGYLDAATDLGEVQVTVKLQAGTTWVRGVVWREEKACRSRRST